MRKFKYSPIMMNHGITSNINFLCNCKRNPHRRKIPYRNVALVSIINVGSSIVLEIENNDTEQKCITAKRTIALCVWWVGDEIWMDMVWRNHMVNFINLRQKHMGNVHSSTVKRNPLKHLVVGVLVLEAKYLHPHRKTISIITRRICSNINFLCDCKRNSHRINTPYRIAAMMGIINTGLSIMLDIENSDTKQKYIIAARTIALCVWWYA